MLLTPTCHIQLLHIYFGRLYQTWQIGDCRQTQIFAIKKLKFFFGKFGGIGGGHDSWVKCIKLANITNWVLYSCLSAYLRSYPTLNYWENRLILEFHALFGRSVPNNRIRGAIAFITTFGLETRVLHSNLRVSWKIERSANIITVCCIVLLYVFINIAA